MRAATALLLTALLAGCAGNAAPPTDDPDAVPTEGEPAVDRRHVDLTGAAGDWVVIIQRFGGVVEGYSLEYRFDLDTEAGADLLTMRPVSNHQGRYGLTGLSGDTLRKTNTGSISAGGSGVASGADYDGIAYAFASSAPWTLTLDSDPTATVVDLVILRGNGAVFGTATASPIPTPASQQAKLDLPMAPDTWALVEPFLGEAPVDLLTGPVIPYATLAADVAGTSCDGEESPVSGQLSGFGAWDHPGTVTATLDVPATAATAELRYTTMPLGNATMPDGWTVGTYCSSHG